LETFYNNKQSVILDRPHLAFHLLSVILDFTTLVIYHVYMENDNEISISEKKLEVLVARFIPTSQYFERSFEMLQKQIDGLSQGQDRIQRDMDKRFEQVDKRFEQVDKRFEQVDKRFEQMIVSINRLSDKLDSYDQDHRSFTMRMFSISIMISFLGVLGVFLKMFHVIRSIFSSLSSPPHTTACRCIKFTGMIYEFSAIESRHATA